MTTQTNNIAIGGHAPSIHQAYRLFEALHAPLHNEQSELRWRSPDTRGSMHRRFFASTEAAAREAVLLGVSCDVYIGVAPRWGSDGARTGVRRLGALWADLDAKGEHTVDSRLRQLRVVVGSVCSGPHCA